MPGLQIFSVMSGARDWLGLFMWVTLLTPLAGSLAVMLIGRWRSAWVPWTALLSAIVTFAGSWGMFASYRFLVEYKRLSSEQPVSPVILFEHELLRLGNDHHGLNFRCILGADGISVVLVWLVSILALSSVLISIKSVRTRQVEYYALLLLMVTASTGVFLAFDLILFYVFFEFTLVPMFFLIGIWGGPERRYAAGKFFIYTLAGSLIGLIALLGFTVQSHALAEHIRSNVEPADKRHAIDHVASNSCSLIELTNISRKVSLESSRDAEMLNRWGQLQAWVFWGLFLAFAIKVPLVPLHTWLPLAHVEAPTAGSVFLAGVLLKLGTYGFLRVCLPLLPQATFQYGATAISLLALGGIIYGSLCAAAQWDIKRLVAYSSIAHMGFCMLGMASLNSTGLAGSVLEMVNHGLSTGGLFLLVGMLYDRYHTRIMHQLGGLAKRLPLWTFFLVWMSMASIALPGLNGFVSETLCLAGMFRVWPAYAVTGTVGIILAVWYMLNMIRQVAFGALREPETHYASNGSEDLNVYEWLAIAVPAALCLVLGVYPNAILDLIRPDVQGLEYLFASLR